MLKKFKDKSMQERKTENKNLKVYNFTKHHISFKAVNLDEAYIKLQEYLKGRSNKSKKREVNNG